MIWCVFITLLSPLAIRHTGTSGGFRGFRAIPIRHKPFS